MISLRRAEARHHDRRRKRETWRTFDPLDRTDRLTDGFGTLETLDESRLPPRSDVPCHPRDEAEIVTYVHEGAIVYEDSLGHSGVIHTGEFQRLVAALGARHGQANASRTDWAHVFQVRLRCSAAEREPGREQKRFSAAERRGGLCVVASSDARRGSLHLQQDARMYSALLEPGQHVVHELAPERAAWLHVVQGEVALYDLVLTTGDGAGITTERAVSLTAREDSEILLFDVAERQACGPRLARATGMTTNTTKDHRPDAKSGAPIEPPSASKTQPAPGVSHPTSEPDLESRIMVRRAELIGKLGELRTDKRLEATEARDKLKARLSELGHIVKWGIVDGWASLGGPVTHKLEQWLAESARQLATENEQS